MPKILSSSLHESQRVEYKNAREFAADMTERLKAGWSFNVESSQYIGEDSSFYVYYQRDKRLLGKPTEYYVAVK